MIGGWLKSISFVFTAFLLASTFARASEDKKPTHNAFQLALEARYHVEKERLKLQAGHYQNSSDPSTAYMHIINDLSSLPQESRAQVIKEMISQLREAVLLETGDGPHRTQLIQSDNPQILQSFLEYLSYLQKSISQTPEEFKKSQKKTLRKAWSRAGLGAAILFATFPLTPILGPVVLVPLAAGMGGMMWGISTDDRAYKDALYRTKFVILNEFFEAIANDAVLMDSLRKRAELSAGEDQERAQKFLQIMGSCSRLLAPPKPESES